MFDDGCILSERTLVEIGDEANLNEESIVQAHSLEEGVFKSDVVRIGAGASIGIGCLVHYGVTMGDGTHLDSGLLPDEGRDHPGRLALARQPGQARAPLGARGGLAGLS